MGIGLFIHSMLLISPDILHSLVLEELTKTDKAEVKRIVSDELEKKLTKKLKKALEDELPAALSKKASKEEIAEITKKVLKRVFKDISLYHPYVIDRIKI